MPLTSRQNHDIRSVGGKYIQMPAPKAGQVGWGNLTIPSPYTQTAAQIYPIGTKFVDDDRVFRYLQVGEASPVGHPLQTHNRFGTATSGDGITAETGTIQAAGVVGDTYLTLTDRGSATPANVFAGGYVTIYWEFLVRRIESNTAEDDPSAGLFRVYLDTPLDIAVSGSSVVTCYRDRYADVRRHVGGNAELFSPVVAVPNRTITDTYYAFGQTWGPCGVAGVDAAGAVTSEQAFYQHAGAHHQGSVTNSSTANMKQYLGPSAASTWDGSSSGVDHPGSLIFINLQLAP